MKEYIEANKDRFFEELFSLLRIPSVSAKKEHKPDMERCASRLSELLLEAGAAEESDVEDIAGVVSFLASKDAGYVTGQVIEISGGIMM